MRPPSSRDAPIRPMPRGLRLSPTRAPRVSTPRPQDRGRPPCPICSPLSPPLRSPAPTPRLLPPPASAPPGPRGTSAPTASRHSSSRPGTGSRWQWLPASMPRLGSTSVCCTYPGARRVRVREHQPGLRDLHLQGLARRPQLQLRVRLLRLRTALHRRPCLPCFPHPVSLLSPSYQRHSRTELTRRGSPLGACRPPPTSRRFLPLPPSAGTDPGPASRTEGPSRRPRSP